VLRERSTVGIARSEHQRGFPRLNRCGIKVKAPKEKLLLHSENFPIDLLFVRDDDIPQLVMDGVCDLGIVGQNVLEESGLHPSNLKLEITESAFLGDFNRAQITMRRLQTLGVAWSLDDFGTGYSSLSYLHRLSVDTVKVDRSFVSRIGLDDGSEMVRVIAEIAHNMGMDVVAEGVETADQLDWLRDIGCEYAQGFYFSKPVDEKAATALIASPPWRGSHPALPGTAVQLQMWPTDPHVVRRVS